MDFGDAADAGQVVVVADTHWKKMALPWMTSESTTFWFRVGSLLEIREDDAAVFVFHSISFDCNSNLFFCKGFEMMDRIESTCSAPQGKTDWPAC